MKTAILYYSKHHGNTKKLLDAIAEKYDVDLIDVTQKAGIDLEKYDRIGFASGIYYSSFAKQILEAASASLPSGKKVFFIATCGSMRNLYFRGIKAITKKKGCESLGEFLCLGFDTFGPFKLVGGVAKGHPTEDEIGAAVKFYESLEG